jgi:hypothetical protein
VAAAAAVAYAWWVTGLEPFSDRATAAVVGGGLAAMALGRRFLPPRPPAGPVAVADLARWGLPVAALVVWQLVAWASEPRSDHPTLSSLANAALDPRPVRALAVVAWLAGAAWLGRR